MSIQLLFANIILLSTVFDITNAFYLSLHTFKWPNASTYCQSYCNSNLASIHSEEDHLKTVDLINRNDYVYEQTWLGLNDIATTDLWVWSDASDFNFGNIRNSATGKIQMGSYPWRIDEPDPYKTSQGVALENGQWIDRGTTSYRYHFLCNDCSGKINKYAIIHGNFNFTAAETACQDIFGTSLASIHNNDDMTEAVIACKQRSKSYGCWIGLNDSDITASTPQYQWTDHTTWDYGTEFYQYPWYAGTPNKGEPCVFLDPQDKTPGEYLWDDHPCDETIKALCNAPSEICDSNQWIIIKGDTNKWIWKSKPYEILKTTIETESIAILANKQYINTAGVLKIDMMYSITSTIIHGNAGIVLYLNNANNANCDNYYYIGVSPQHSIIFIGKYINNVFDLIASEYLITAFDLNTQYLLSIELKNGIEWNILFNKQPMIQIADNQFNNENNLGSGYIGIRNVNVQINVKSFYISGQIQYEDNNIWYNQCRNEPTSIDNNPIFTSQPTIDPSISPTLKPTVDPSISPTLKPTIDPSTSPTLKPTVDPSVSPIEKPTKTPTTFPSLNPTKFPSLNPTKFPSQNPTKFRSENPTKFPSENPTKFPSETATKFPTKFPSENPTTLPSQDPTKFPSSDWTNVPTTKPSVSPSTNPTNMPTQKPLTFIKREFALAEKKGKGMDKTTIAVMITLVIISIIGIIGLAIFAFYKKKGKFKRNQTVDELPEVETYHD